MRRSSRAFSPGTPRPERPEHQIHRALVKALRLTCADCLVHHGDSGGRTPAERRRKAELGALAGFPDLQVLLPDGRSLFIEVKSERGRLTPAQKAVLGWLTEHGFPARVFSDVKAAVAWVAAERQKGA